MLRFVLSMAICDEVVSDCLRHDGTMLPAKDCDHGVWALIIYHVTTMESVAIQCFPGQCLTGFYT